MKYSVRYVRASLFYIALLCGVTSMARADDPPFAIGLYTSVIREVPRKDVELSLRFWIGELVHEHVIEYQPIKLYDDFKVMSSDLEQGKINFIIAPAMGIVENLPVNKLADGFSGYLQSRDDLVLLVRRDANISQPADLRGKRISLLDDDMLMDKYIQVLLMRAGLRSDLSQLRSVLRESRCNKQINQLFFGQADAALVYSSAFELATAMNPQIGQRLQVLDTYAFSIRSPYIGLFSASLSPAYRERITNAALLMDNSARGKQVLQVYHADVMERTSISDLQAFKLLLDEHKALRRAEVKGKR